jgi:hypothetical protein
MTAFKVSALLMERTLGPELEDGGGDGRMLIITRPKRNPEQELRQRKGRKRDNGGSLLENCAAALALD